MKLITILLFSVFLFLMQSRKPETTLLQHVVAVVVLAAVVAVGGVGMVTVTVPTVTFPTLMATQEDLIVLLQTMGQLQLALKKAKVVSVVPVGHAGLTVVAPAGVGMEMVRKARKAGHVGHMTATVVPGVGTG